MKTRASLFLFGCLASASGSTYYADASRSDDTGDGTSWAAAKQTIQAAVDLTSDGDTVLVTNGVYNIGGADSLADTNAPSFGPFYRVKVELP